MDIAEHEKEHEILGVGKKLRALQEELKRYVSKEELPKLADLDHVLEYGNISKRDAQVGTIFADDGIITSVTGDSSVFSSGKWTTVTFVSMAGDNAIIDNIIASVRFRFPTAQPPAPNDVGEAYYDSATDTLYIWDGTAWRPH